MRNFPKFLIFCFLTIAHLAFSQAGNIGGTIISEKGDTLDFAMVSLFKNGEQINLAYSDFVGHYQFSGLDAGSYDVQVEMYGYQTQKVSGVIVGTNQAVALDFKMPIAGETTEEVRIVVYRKPLIDKDKQATVLTGEEIENLAVRDVAAVAATSVDVVSKDDGSGDLNVRGARASGTQFIVDGVKMTGRLSIPQTAIEQVEVISGGLPAMYGDNIGGVVVITTKGVTSRYFGNLEAVTSSYLDGYGYNLITGSYAGPIIPAKRDSTGKVIKNSPLGFMLAGEYTNILDNRPSAVGNWKVKDDVLTALENDPLRPGISGTGTLRNSEFITLSDLEQIKARQNAAQQNLNLTGKIDFQPKSNMTFSVGGNVNYRIGHAYIYEYSLFNPSNNPQEIVLNYNTFARWKHKLNTNDTSSTALFKNAYYQFQIDFSQTNYTQWDDSHKDQVFEYGHIGQFQTTRNPNYEWDPDGANGAAYYYKGEESLLYEFIQAGNNPNASKFTTQYYEIYGGNPEGNYETWQQVQNGGALLNGDRPENVYDLWYNVGRQYGGYNKNQTDQIRANWNAAFTYNETHNITFGMEFEKRTIRVYNIAPIGLWTQMRELANAKNTQLDTDNPELVYRDGVFQDTVNYVYAYTPDADGGKGFFENVRDLYGVSYNDFFDTDFYGPEAYNLSLFTADEIYQEGNGAVYQTYGYDHMGNKTNPGSYADFFSKKNDNGAYLREIKPFQPIYAAGFIQDKFQFKDIVFNVGVRIDRYDANQPVLKDPLSLYPIRSAQDLANAGYEIPAVVNPDAKVYVNDLDLETPTIVGYRVGEQWYDASGNELENGYALAASTATGSITPYLVDKDADIKSEDFDFNGSFEDYTPQYSFMPRISFTFNLSENASFFAHYDWLSQRPNQSYAYFLPTDYLYLENNVGGFIRNPNLKPQKTTDYEVGYQQALNYRSAITISAYYREITDLIQVRLMDNAYPNDYMTMGNIDFATVKGFSVKYDLRPISTNLSVTAGYTIQFAEGTGSSEAEKAALIQAGFEDYRFITPLSFDQRHTFKGIFDYRFRPGKGYNGPDFKGHGRKILGGLGINVVAKLNSGTPYTRQSNFTAQGLTSGGGRATLAGSINGSRLPWIYNLDMRINKQFVFGIGKEKGNRYKSEIYLVMTNVLNTKNVINVYSATGNPNDDGYLDAASSQNAILATTNPVSFQDLYNIKIDNPYNYALPRMIRLGFVVEF